MYKSYKLYILIFLFFFNDTATTEIYTLSLHDALPIAGYPRHHAKPTRLDWTVMPPRPGRAFGSLVSAVNADGNEVAGLVLPELAAPLATHTGWNLRHPDIGGAE